MAVDALQLRYFADYIESNAGIVYSESNQYQLVRRLQEIATQVGTTVPDLYQRLRKGLDPAFRDMLLDVATNNETSFFRDPTVFASLEAGVVPELAKAANGRPLRIWSAAASTGQEAYSLVMMLEGMRARGAFTGEYTILGTDLSERVLKKARSATYSHLEVQRGLSARQLVQHFAKTPDGHWALKPELAKRVRFQTLNLLADWPVMPTFDLILCRNILIYFNVANKGRILKKVHAQMAPHARLVLGATETMLGLPERALFEDERVGSAYAFKRVG